MSELDSKLVRNNGHWERHSWVLGAYEDRGEVIQGKKGTETFIRKTVIKPVVIFEVREGRERTA